MGPFVLLAFQATSDNCDTSAGIQRDKLKSEPEKLPVPVLKGRKNLHVNLAPVLVILSGKSPGFSRKISTSTGFCRYCAPDASAPVALINESPTEGTNGAKFAVSC